MSLQINNVQQQSLQNYLVAMQSQKQCANQNTAVQQNNNPFLKGQIQMVALNKNLKSTANNIKDAKNNDKKETKGDEANVKEKSTLESAAGVAGKHAFSNALVNKCTTLSDLTKVTPATIIMTAVGVDFEEDADALKEGAVSGKGGDFKAGYKKFFTNFGNARDKALKEGTWATIKEGVKQGLNFIPNLGSITITNAMKYAGKGISKILGKDVTTGLGSMVAFGGKLINTIGDTIGNSVKGVFGAVKGIFKGNALDALKETGKNFKKIGISVKNKAVTLAKDVAKGAKAIAKGVTTVAKKVVEGTKKAVKKVGSFFKRLFG